MSNRSLQEEVSRILEILRTDGNFGIDYMEQKTFEAVYGASEFVVVMPDDRKIYE